jgi:hypothetical protein
MKSTERATHVGETEKEQGNYSYFLKIKTKKKRRMTWGVLNEFVN